LTVIEAENNVTITVEVAWRMHLEKDLNYTHVFGKEGGAYMNPLRLYKELHGKLVNVTPIEFESNVDIFKKSFENEMTNFIRTINGEEEPITPVEDGLYLMEIIDAIYESAKLEKHIDLGS
jgi:predicted dehydrogenase